MKLVERSEVMGLADYETIRDRFRNRIIEEKKRRRLKLGDSMSVVFENRDTVLMQIQEMLRTERITREAAILHEIETYNQLVPVDHELSATGLVEIDDKDARERFLFEARGLDRSFSLVVDGEVCRGQHDEAREHPERTTAVHYLKFQLTPNAEAALRDVLGKKRSVAEVVVDHPRYTARTRLAPETLLSVVEDLA